MKRFIIYYMSGLRAIVPAVICLAMACSDKNEVEPAPGQFDYKDFKNNYGLNLLGSAAVITEKIPPRTDETVAVRLAQPAGIVVEQLGGFWYGRSRMAVAQGFTTTFRFKPSTMNSPRAFSFVIQNAGQDSLGTVGTGTSPGFGFVASSNSVTIGFSTRQNNVRILTREATPNSPFKQESGIYPVPALTNLAAGHEIRIEYEPGTLTVFLNGEKRVTAEGLKLDEKLKLTDGKAYVGFTGVTDPLSPNHDIVNWSFIPK
jgi:hypothetical protein